MSANEPSRTHCLLAALERADAVADRLAALASRLREAEVIEIESWPIGRPQPYGNNPRTIGDQAVRKLAALIREVGFLQPLVVDDRDVIVAGHTRLRAAKELGLSHVPVVVVRDLTPDQIQLYRIADNRVNQDTSWSKGLTDELLDLLPRLDDVSLLGFDEAELKLFCDPASATEATEGQGGGKTITRADAVVVELLLSPAALARVKSTLLRWSAAMDIEVSYPEG